MKYINKIILPLIIVIFLLSGFSFLEKEDINSLSNQELYTILVEINGIGEATATKVIQYREVNGYIEIDDLDSIKGIGNKRERLIKKYFK